MKRREATPQEVRNANRRFYDAIAERYEEVDGRRSPALEAWLRERLAALRQRVPGGRLLDIGAGSGLVARCAQGIFALRVGLDISPRILAAHRSAFDLAVVGDVAALPFADASFDAVTCFAVLHHLHSFERLVREVVRVLGPGGVFYADHDMDSSFWRRFRWPLAVYRKLLGAQARYRRASPEISPELYAMAEWQEEGVDSLKVVRLFETAGCSVEVRYHWFGLSPLLDRLLGAKPRRRGWAPLASLVATKTGVTR